MCHLQAYMKLWPATCQLIGGQQPSDVRAWTLFSLSLLSSVYWFHYHIKYLGNDTASEGLEWILKKRGRDTGDPSRAVRHEKEAFRQSTSSRWTPGGPAVSAWLLSYAPALSSPSTARCCPVPLPPHVAAAPRREPCFSTPGTWHPHQCLLHSHHLIKICS